MIRRRLHTRPATATVVVGSVLLATGLCAWQLTLPGVLTGVTEYDDGVYLGAALRFVSGVLPYRDFVFVQPPGIVLLMSPIALLGRAIGSSGALIVARVATMLVAGLNAGLTSLLVRSRGRLAMAVAGGTLAVFPLAVTADHTLLLEPYLVLFVLIGSTLVFDRRDPSFRRVALGGLFFGVAGAVKLWAVFPFVALLVCFVPRWRARILPLFAGATLGFGILCLPFVVGAPDAFFHEVFIDQLFRESSVASPWSIGSRLAAITGFPGTAFSPPSPALAIGSLSALGALVLLAYGIGRRELRRVDVYVLLAALGSTLGLLAGRQFYRHYAYFSAPFLAALLGVSVSAAAETIRRILTTGRRHRHPPSWTPTLVVMCAIAVLVLLVVEETSYARSYLPYAVSGPGYIVDPGAAIDAVIPDGSCVIFDEAILTIESNRFSSSVPNCPKVVDPYGMWLSFGPSPSPTSSAPSSTSFVATWKSYLEAAQYLVLWVPESDYIPWDPSLLSWFDKHYRPVQTGTGSYVYYHFAGQRS